VRGDRQRLSSTQQNEKNRAGVEQSVVKELAPLQQSTVSANESSFGTSTSGGDSNQELPDGATAGKQLQAQDLQGQLGADHQKIPTVTSKPIPIESVRQDIPEHVMQQVKDRLVQHEVKAGSQQITLTLSPDSMGELKMNLNLQGQKLSVEIVTESRSIRDAIVQHTDSLKESLARQNITMESFDVTTGGKGSGNQGLNQNAWREMAKQQQQQQFWATPRGYNTAQADLPSGLAAYPQQPGQSMLDIHY
jgi:flagellar hook-length control protein FliK